MGSSSPPSHTRLAATFGDEAVHIISSCFVPEIQLVVDLDGELDEGTLSVALRRLLDAVPVLGCRFVPRAVRPHWRRLPEGELDRAGLLEVSREPAGALGDAGARDLAVATFLATPLRPEDGPQVRALLVQAGARSRLALKVSHLPADTAATKQVGYALAAIHRQALADPSYAPPTDPGSRRIRQAFARVGLLDVPALLRVAAATQLRHAVPPRTVRFPAGREAAGSRPTFVLRHLDAARVSAVKAWGRRRRATLNDLLVAAGLRALARLARRDARSRLRLKTTVDLRRHLEGRDPPGVCNLSSFVFVDLGSELGAGFEETLARAKADLDAAKARHMGLDYLLLFGLLGAGVPFGLASRGMRAFLDLQERAGSASPTFTNLGTVDLGRLDFGEARSRAAHVVVPACHPPSFAFGASGDGAGLTLSAGVFEPAVSAAEVERYFALIEDELAGLCPAPVLSSLRGGR